MIAPGTALCLTCGRSGRIAWESMDPLHPFIRCEWRKPGGAMGGHGVVLGTLDQAESDAIQVQRREKRLALGHARGSHDQKPTHLCPLCELEKPHRGHVRARYSDPTCDRCQAAAAQVGPNPGTATLATSAGAVAVTEVRE